MISEEQLNEAKQQAETSNDGVELPSNVTQTGKNIFNILNTGDGTVNASGAEETLKHVRAENKLLEDQNKTLGKGVAIAERLVELDSNRMESLEIENNQLKEEIKALKDELEKLKLK